MTLIEERYELVKERLQDMLTEQAVSEKYTEYFHQMAEFGLLVMQNYEQVQEGWLDKASLQELRAANQALYEDILEENYETSYANPAYACAGFGLEMGRLLSFMYTELRSMIAYAYEGMQEELVIRLELLVEVYGVFTCAAEEDREVEEKELQEVLYWFVSDYSEPAAEWRVSTLVDPENDFAVRIVKEADLTDIRYLYRFGEYISSDVEKMAQYLNTLSQERVQMIADTYTEGYRIGFVKGNKDLSRKETVDVRFCLGFERIVRAAISNFAKMGLKPTIYRASSSIFHKRGTFKTGYYGAAANKQYEYDHKDDLALFLDRKLMNRKLEVLKQAYEENKDKASRHAGPAVIETFGEIPFAPVSKPEACTLSTEQQKLSSEYTGASSDIVYQYINGEERSFTIIAFPVP